MNRAPTAPFHWQFPYSTPPTALQSSSVQLASKGRELAFLRGFWHDAATSNELSSYAQMNGRPVYHHSFAASQALRFAIPLSLTFLRLLLAPLVLWWTWAGAPRGGYAVVLTIGFLSDYFDGVLARRLGVVRPWLRRLDSATDLVFYLCVFVAAASLEPLEVRRAAPGIVLLLLSETACITISLWRFGVFPATHCYSAKLYGLVVWIVLLGVLAFGWGARAIWGLTVIGLVANLEVILILLHSTTPPVDVPSFWTLRTRER